MATANPIIERLKEQIRQVQAAPRQHLVTLATGLAEVDALGLFRLGGAVELCGEEASGRTSLALKVVAAAGRERRLSAWVDGPAELYPPAAVPLGVDLKRLLIVRPKAPGQLVWAAVQLLRSGAFTCVVLDVTHTGVQLTMTDTRKLLDAARAGGALLMVVSSQAAPAPGLVRLMMRTSCEEPRPERHLRAVPDDAEPPSEPIHRIEVVHRGGVARRAVMRRPALGLGGARRRAQQEQPQGLVVPQVSARSGFHRVKQHELRDGRGFYGATRPGRDSHLELPLGAPDGEG